MSVLVEGVSVIIKMDAILKKIINGWDGFEALIPNQTMCTDGEIVRIGFMRTEDAIIFVENLQLYGLHFLQDNKAIDMVLADQMFHLTPECDWLELGHVNSGHNDALVVAGRLFGSQVTQLATPSYWIYEGSLSATYECFTNDHEENGLKFIRHENGVDVYLNPLTGKEMYVGRTSV
jgi:hypothetical protein